MGTLLNFPPGGQNPSDLPLKQREVSPCFIPSLKEAAQKKKPTRGRLRLPVPVHFCHFIRKETISGGTTLNSHVAWHGSSGRKTDGSTFWISDVDLNLTFQMEIIL